MMTKEQFTDILLTLANRDAFGAASLGYLPHMLYAKWLLDNKEYEDDIYIGSFGTYCRNLGDVKYLVPAPNELDIPFREERLAPFGQKDDLEGIFHNLSDEMAVMQYRNLCSKFEEVKAQITKVLMSLDLSEKNIARKDIAAGFDAYLEEMIAAGGADISLDPSVSEKVIAQITKENWLDDLSEYICDHIYDPFCKFGTLYKTLPKIKVKDLTDGVIKSESPLYQEIAHIRLGFHGVTNDMGHDSPISSPRLTPNGELYRYELVISDISGISSEKISSAFQLDIHKRYQTFYPNAETLNQDTAMFTILGSLSGIGHAAIITGNCRGIRPTPMFHNLDSGMVKSFLVHDILEAIIDVPVRDTGATRGPMRRRVGELSQRSTKRIYIFGGAKPAERKNKVLFIDATSMTNDQQIIDTVAACYREYTEIPGISAIVPLEKILVSPRPELYPSAYTTVLEEPKPEDTSVLLRDIKRLEDRRIALNKDIVSLVESLTKKTP